MVADIYVWRISGLVLSHQYARRFGSKPPHGFAIGVNDKPLAALLKVLPARNECAHDTNLQIYRKEDEQKEYEMAFSFVKAHANL